MKKILLIAAVAGFVMTSCKKDYTCECTTSDSSGTIPSQTVSATAKLKKSEAEDWCSESNTSVGTIKTECKLK